jgi:pimeloyl-ACP methyl ester carboxylesterase
MASTLHVGGAERNVRRGRGEPLVLLHGGGSSWREYNGMLPLLAAERDVIALKTPGHHDGPPLDPVASLSVPDFADYFECELDRLGLETVDIVGHSFGGWQALELARRGRARTVVAIAPAGGWTPAEAEEVERKFATQFIPNARRAAPLMPLVARSSAGRRALCADLGTQGRRLSPSTAVAFVTALGRWPLAPRLHEFLADSDGTYRTAHDLAEVCCPVLLLWGSSDAIVPLRQAQHFVEQLPDVSLIELPTGHFPQFDLPDVVAQSILDFTGTAGRSEHLLSRRSVQ